MRRKTVSMLLSTVRMASTQPAGLTSAVKSNQNGRVMRSVDGRGFRANLSTFSHLSAPETVSFVQRASQSTDNFLFCGSPGTGKLTTLRAIGEALEQKGLRVAYSSFDAARSHRLDGVVIHNILGLRVNSEDLPIQEQMEGMFERHVRLVDSTYENAVHSITSCDVLIIDSLHLAPSVILNSLDAVGRRVRGNPNQFFGGLRIIASADFWALNVHPGSDTGGFIFQLPQWDDMFPHQIYLEEIHGQSEELRKLTDAALMGNLTPDDIKTLHGKSAKGSMSSQALKSKSSGQLPPSSLMANSSATFLFTPRFPKQPAVMHNPPKATQIKRVEIGNFLINLLYQTAFAERYNMIGKLSLAVGSKANLIFPLLKRVPQQPSSSTVRVGGFLGRKKGNATPMVDEVTTVLKSSGSEVDVVDIPAGTLGEVMQVRDHFITMSFPSLNRTVDIPRLRVSLWHDHYPELTYHTEQYPLMPRDVVMPELIIKRGGIWSVAVDCRLLADTNDLGNILARMRTWDDFSMTNIRDYLKLEGVVHEPTRIYYNKIRGRKVSQSVEQWCKNCKAHVNTDKFYNHWKECIANVRWCSECNEVVKLAKLEAHQEKHQIVLCIDCGQAVEWRHWDAHRLGCIPMMRELSSDNEFLPEVTRKVSIELGLDKRDLHTVKELNKSCLPKNKKDVLNRGTL